MKIYTKCGDKGTTSLADGRRVSKDDLQIELNGAIDELNAHIGLLLSFLKSEEQKEVLLMVQCVLFNIGALVTGVEDVEKYGVKHEEIKLLEDEIDKLQSALPPLHDFILPGGSVASSQAHICRTVCRRAERRLVAWTKGKTTDGNSLAFMNRLSDYFFVLARANNNFEHTEEKTWRKTCK